MAAHPPHPSRNPSAPSIPEGNPQKHKAKVPTKSKGKERAHSPHLAVNGVSNGGSLSSNQNLTWDWLFLTDPAATRVPPLFTDDGSYFFSLAGSTVKIYSAETGVVVSTLTAPPPSSDSNASVLTSLALSPHNPFQLITGSLDGRITFWDFVEANLLRVIDIAQPIQHLYAHKDVKDSIFVTVLRPAKKGSTDINGAVLRVNIASSKPLDIQAIGKVRRPAGLTISANGLHLVAIGGHTVYVAKMSALSSGFTKFVSPERLTCLAVHPTEEYFATGDEKGNIRIWYCLNDQLPAHVRGVEKRTATTNHHWHAHAVSSIAFTSNGAYLISGGEEAVLVIWQLHTGRKEFIPRVGAPISTVSLRRAGDIEEYLLGLSDATYIFVSAASLKISRSISRIKLDSAVSTTLLQLRNAPLPLAVHHLTSTIILPSSHPSSLQIYSPATSTLISELEVSPSNRISRRDEKPIEPARIGHVEISPDGSWMATVDVREGDESFRGEVYLKFWSWERNSSQWVLNTRIDRPHGLNRVTAMAFSPSHGNKPMEMVSTGNDGTLKIWRLRERDAEGRSTTNTNTDFEVDDSVDFWIVKSTFQFRSDTPITVSWSPDASLLAVPAGSHVTLLNAHANRIARNLPSPDGTSIHSATFIGRSGRFVLVATCRTLALWDLVAQNVRWDCTTISQVLRVSAHPKNDELAVFHHDHSAVSSQISIFRTSSSTPVSTHLVPFNVQSISRFFSPNTFIGITDDWRVMTNTKSLFQDIFGSTAFSQNSISATSGLPISRPVTATSGRHPLDAPAHLLPPLETLYDSLMEGFIRVRLEPVPSTVAVAEDEDEDEAMEDTTNTASPQDTISRTVDEEEMQSLIALFRSQAIKRKSYARRSL
ncbi:hypothetical protein AX16_000459 [Volvariella volvacea WC 439]|nr:hypothetical protein AX16_000459 [Volvariella volvacea WC 439]